MCMFSFAPLRNLKGMCVAIGSFMFALLVAKCLCISNHIQLLAYSYLHEELEGSYIG